MHDVGLVATLTFLLSFLARKANNLIQAIFGWSVTALFGKLPRRAQLLVTAALVLSIAWPLFVIGSIVPHVASWAIAFLPLHHWAGSTTMRIIWLALAAVTPMIVGLLVHLAVPAKQGTALHTMVRGYPVTLGFFLAFVVVVVTVPLIKIGSILRGWSDEHVYLEPREGQYDRVFRSLGEACARAGLTPEVTDAPRHMVLATTIMRTFSRGAVGPIVTEQLRRITADGLQLYLYPADLLMRGPAKKVARVRAMLSRTTLDAEAYLVASETSRRVQDELARLTDILTARQRAHVVPGAMLEQRLREVYREMIHADVSYEDWVILETIARRVERRLVLAGAANAVLPPLDAEPDRLQEIGDRANRFAAGSDAGEGFTMPEPMPPDHDPLDDLSTPQLLSRALGEAKELARVEIELAKQDMKQETKAAMRAARDFAIAFACALLVITMLLMSIVLKAASPALALGIAGGFLVVGGIAAAIGYSTIPKKPLEPTRQRLANDVDQLKEHLA